MMAVDILPAAIPIDASRHFSDALLPYLTTLIEEHSYGRSNSESLSSSVPAPAKNREGKGEISVHSSALRKATVAIGGELTKDHKWLQELVEPHVRLKQILAAAKEEEGNGDNDRREALPSNSSASISPSQLPAEIEQNRRNTAKAAQSSFRSEASNSAAYSLYVSRLVSKVGAERMSHGQSLNKKQVLLLGSGMVAQPVVDYLVCKAGVEVMIGS
jgi:alpha-aminoadipic semialdehyde synthase